MYKRQGFVIAEIYAAGSPNAAGTGGLKDTFVRIYNNSDETLYADGLAIVESDFVNAKASNHKILTGANDRNKNFTAGVVWVIPGAGKDVPVAVSYTHLDVYKRQLLSPRSPTPRPLKTPTHGMWPAKAPSTTSTT